ncbi:chemotaxis response regulator protein-glutamate methylesterase [Flammeovirgaceae bacterium SG7u.111]|nr:chemotaxis response regulator protein-glutamate methylesterase [Flammeovirgaceae bacterium SG7u.132]WPO34334.1 chemotaxis response regulator protein-glutamate methylesterase [Flammeovirgaceae bacterium SG7u.111]
MFHKIKVLIVDDSASVRQALKTILDKSSEIEVIGTAMDPYYAVKKIQKHKPDVITLDIEMPRMDGLTFLKKIMKQAPMPVVIISNHTKQGANSALKALELGAVEVIAKPELSTEQDIKESEIRLVDIIRSAYYSKRRKTGSLSPEITRAKVHQAKLQNSKKSIITVGASTGGTEALKTFLEAMPPNCPPIVIVQHMPEKFTLSFAQRLNECCTIRVKEAVNNDILEQGTAYIAPGNFHMSVVSSPKGMKLITYQGELVNRHRPSVNVLFHSVAKISKNNSIGIIMTGMGNDGAEGLLALKNAGAYTIAQDEASSVVFGMPKQAIEIGAALDVVPLKEISEKVCYYLEEDTKQDS